MGKDGRQRKATYPALHGVEQSRRIASRLVEEACKVLAPYGSRAEKLKGIAEFLLIRTT